MWEEVLRQENISRYDDFFDIGGISVTAVSLISRISEAFNIPLTHEIFLEDATIAGLSAQILSYQKKGAFPKASLKKTDLEQEATLPSDMQITGKEIKDQINPKAILLTGATGFLGAYIVKELLIQTQATIYCLVRASNEKEGFERIKNNLSSYGMYDEKYSKRLKAVAGDLSKSGLGVDKKQYIKLSSEIDRIYHNGALVNFILSYDRLKEANVDGTKEVLRFACRERLIPVHYVSTLAVFNTPGMSPEQVVTERKVTASDAEVIGGYAQSKWVGERLLTRAQEQGMPVTIYRPGAIAPADDHTTKLVLSDMFNSFMFSCLELEAMPDFSHMHVDFSPVDYVAKALVCLSLLKNNEGQVYHLNNEHSVTFGEIREMIAYMGQRIRLLSFESWRKEARNLVGITHNSHLAPMFPIFEDKLQSIKETWFEFISKVPRFDNTNTITVLKTQGITNTPINKKMILRLLLGTYTTEELLIPDENIKIIPGNTKKILILTASMGGGHNSAAAKVAARLIELCQGKTIEIKVIKLEEIDRSIARTAHIYNHISRNRLEFYDDWFEQSISISDDYVLLQEYQQKMARKIYNTERPDVIVSVIGSASLYFEAFKAIDASMQCITCVTDWFGKCFHQWGSNGADLLYSPHPDNAAYLIENTPIEAHKVKIGHPILNQNLEVLQKTFDRKTIKKELGIDNEEPILLFNTYGNMQIARLLEDQSFEELNVIVLCYRDRQVFGYVESLESAHIYPVLWTDEIEKYMYVADGIFTKPGPGIIQDAIVSDTIIFVNTLDTVMVQEQEVVNYILDKKVGIKIGHKNKMENVFKMLKTQNASYRKLLDNIKKISLKNGLYEFCNEVLKKSGIGE